MDKKFCTSCGEKLDLNSSFCSNCGSKVEPTDNEQAEIVLDEEPTTAIIIDEIEEDYKPLENVAQEENDVDVTPLENVVEEEIKADVVPLEATPNESKANIPTGSVASVVQTKLDKTDVSKELKHIGQSIKEDWNEIKSSPKKIVVNSTLEQRLVFIGGILAFISVYFMKFVNIGYEGVRISGSLSDIATTLKVLSNTIAGINSLLGGLVGSSSSTSQIIDVGHSLSRTVVAITIISILIIISAFLKNKIVVAISCALSLILLIVDLVLNSKVNEFLRSISVSETGAFGGKLLLISILIMLVGTGIRTFKAFKK